MSFSSLKSPLFTIKRKIKNFSSLFMSSSGDMSSSGGINQLSDQFSQYSEQWWNTKGSMSMLHRLNLLRLEYIQQILCQYYPDSKFTDNTNDTQLSIADIGCGGGILSIPLARLGYKVYGFDISPSLVSTAQNIAVSHQLSNVEFKVADLVNECPEDKVDILMAMEIVEHIGSDSDKESFFTNCIQMIKPGGLLFIATINRNLFSFFKAIIAAEYIFDYVPVGTHKYSDFITPYQIIRFIEKAAGTRNVNLIDIVGVEYHFLDDSMKISEKIDTNYIICLKLC